MQAAELPLVHSIQYLRGIAALMVVWHHAARQIEGVAAHFPSAVGAHGVDLFFVISGFIMVLTTANRPIGPVQFLKRRALRIVPLYWALTLLMVCAALVAPGLFRTLIIEPQTLALSLLFVPHFSLSHPDQVVPLLVPGWTLNFEMYFYLVFGLLLTLREPRRTLVLVAYLVASVAIGWLIAPSDSAFAQTYTNPMLLEFAAGALIGRAWVSGRLRLPLASSLLAIVLGFVLLLWVDPGPLAWAFKLAGSSMIVVGALDERLASWRLDALHKLGDASYSIYLTHLFTLGVLRVWWARMVDGDYAWSLALSYMAVALLASALAGYAAYVWLEKPLLSRLVGRRNPSSVLQGN